MAVIKQGVYLVLRGSLSFTRALERAVGPPCWVDTKRFRHKDLLITTQCAKPRFLTHQHQWPDVASISVGEPWSTWSLVGVFDAEYEILMLF